jgi:hypothetical protein
MTTLLQDAAQWVYDELADPAGHERDQVFKAENDTRRGVFQKGNARYELIMPDGRPTESEWIRNEKFVDGQNLINLRVVDDHPTDVPAGVINREDYKHAASLLVRNYVYQVMRGSYAHSDIHLGNFRITADNAQLAVFDRHNLIPMDDRLRATIKAAFGSILMGDFQGAATAIASYATTDTQSVERLKATLGNLAPDPSNPAKFVSDTMFALKREGIRVPLSLSLLLRNFMSVSQMSGLAGFNNIVEAFLHTAQPDELQGISLAPGWFNKLPYRASEGTYSKTTSEK